MLQHQHLLIICTVWPEPLSSAAGKRMMQLISFFREEGCRVTIACDAQESPYSDSLSASRLDKIRIELNQESFNLQLKVLEPTIVLFDRFMTEEKYGWRVADECPQALRILDTEDLHCLRKARQDALKKGLDYRDVLAESEVAKREVASIYRCDLSLMISPAEIELLGSVFRVYDHILHYIPLLAGSEAENLGSCPDFGSRRHFVSIGNFLHEPNTDAVHYLKSTIWPLIRKRLPEAQLHVYGAYTNSHAYNLHNEKQGFLIKGRAENAKDVISRARVLLAPLRFGAGIKGKLLESMEYGTPSVTSTVGAEGMHGNLSWNGYITDDPQTFAAQAADLYQSEAHWTEAQQQGFTLVRTLYESAFHFRSLREKLNSILRDLPAHRRSNFTGSMLRHHSLNSTKYMSRWIELKNRTP